MKALLRLLPKMPFFLPFRSFSSPKLQQSFLKIPLFRFATTPPPQQPKNLPPATPLDTHLGKIAIELSNKQKEGLIIAPTEYLTQVEKVATAFGDTTIEGGLINREESIEAIIYLCVMTVETINKLPLLDILRSLPLLYRLSSDLRFQFSKDHILKILNSIPSPMPSEVHIVFPAMMKLICRLADTKSLEPNKVKIQALINEYLVKHSNEWKINDIASIFESWMLCRIIDDNNYQMLINHMIKLQKILPCSPIDLHSMMHFQATTQKSHKKEYIDFLMEKAKDLLPQFSTYLMANLIAFATSLGIHDHKFLGEVIDTMAVRISEPGLQLPPITLMQLMVSVRALETVLKHEKAKEFMGKLEAFFVKDEHILKDEKNWDFVSLFILLKVMTGGNNQMMDKFYEIAGEITEKLIQDAPKEWIGDYALILSRLSKELEREKMKNVLPKFRKACEKEQKNLTEVDKSKLKAVFNGHKAFEGYEFQKRKNDQKF